MKKHFHFLAAVAALMTCACSVEPVDVVDVQPEEEGEFTVLTAGFAGAEDETRTVRQADGKVFWSPKDEISIIRGSRKAKFTAQNTEPAASASFEGTMPTGTTAFWAVYPYKSTDNIQNVSGYNYMVTSLPAEQEAVAGSFADDLFISAAYVKNGTTGLTFHHQCGGVKFSVTQPGVKRVTLVPADGSVFLAGLIGLYASSAGQTPYIRATGNEEDMSNKVELSAPEGKTLEVGAAYHIVTIPATLKGGLSLFLEKEDGTTALRTVSKDVTIKAGHFVTLMDADKGVTYQDPYLEYSPESISVDGLGGLFAVDVKGTAEYHIDVTSTDWIHAVSESGDARFGRRYVYLADKNDGDERIGMLSVCYGGNCYPLLVTQSALGALKVYPHRTMAMRFTSTKCGYCPVMVETYRLAKEALGDSFVNINFYTTYNGGEYSYEGSETLADYYLVKGFPTGIIDGRFDLPNYSSNEYGSSVICEEAVKTVQYYPTATAIGLSSTLSGRDLSVKVDVRAQFEEDYRLTVVLVENGIVGFQSDYNAGNHNDFVHNKVARMNLTSITGDDFSVNAPGSVRTLTYQATIPSGYKIENMEVIAFVQRNFNDRPAIQSDKYGEWYVDNCRAAALGTAAPLEVE